MNPMLTGAGLLGNAANITGGKRNKTVRIAEEIDRKRKDCETGSFEPEVG